MLLSPVLDGFNRLYAKLMLCPHWQSKTDFCVSHLNLGLAGIFSAVPEKRSQQLRRDDAVVVGVEESKGVLQTSTKLPEVSF